MALTKLERAALDFSKAYHDRTKFKRGNAIWKRLETEGIIKAEGRSKARAKRMEREADARLKTTRDNLYLLAVGA